MEDRVDPRSSADGHATEPHGYESTDSALEAALADVLEWTDRGVAVDVPWLRERHPRYWRDLAEVLVLEGRLAGLVTALERVGPYRVVERLGDGGMGAVYLAVDERPERPGPERVALKVLHPHLVGDAEFFSRFLREAQVGAQIVHPNVVRTLDADVIEQDGAFLHVLVMEYVEGQTLRALLDDLGRVSEQLCRQIGREVARALIELHARGIVHRDVKPENVLLTPDQSVRLMDLGIARPLEPGGRVSRSGVFVGSWAYAAPEQFGRDGVGFSADLYALGLSLYELATGVHPFASQELADAIRTRHTTRPAPASDHNPQLSPFFEEVLRTLIEPEPRARFESAARLALVLERGEESDWWKARASLLRANRRPMRRIRIPRETAFHGRGRELTGLSGAFTAARSGAGHVVLVEGEAGIGKSRLVDAFARDLAGRGTPFHFLYGCYPPGGVAAAASAFREAALPVVGEETPEAALAPFLGETPRLLGLACAWFRGEPAGPGPGELDEPSLRTLLAKLLRGLSEERPVVLVIEDLHFAPDEGRGLFASLAPALDEHRVLLVGTTRPDVPAPWRAEITRRPGTSVLALGRLDGLELERLVKDALGAVAVPASVAREVAVKSDGNPFFLFEIVRGLREGRFASEPGGGEWLSTGEVSAIRVPDSIRGLVEERVAGLTPAERDLVEAASCCGNEFDGALVGEALDLGRLEALRTLARIEAHQHLVRSVGQHYRFDHHLVLETLYAALSPPLRSAYHEALAVTLEGRSALDPESGAKSDATAAEICRHYVRAGRSASALPHLDAAFAHLDRGYRHAAAVRLADAVLETEDLVDEDQRLRLLLHRAAHLEPLGRREEERADLDEALKLSDALGEPAARSDARFRLGEHLRGMAEYEAARRVLAEAVALAREAEDRRLEGRATGTYGAVLWNLGEYEESEQHLERFRAIAQETGDVRGEATANGHLGNLHHALGRPDDARRCFERRIELAREVGDLRGEAIATGNLAVLASARSEFGPALALHRRNLALSRELGFREGVAVSLVNLGAELIGMGALDEADPTLDEALSIVRAIGARRVEVYVLHAQAVLLEFQGRLSGAETKHRECIALAEEIAYPYGASGRLQALGALLIEAGRPEDARPILERALADAVEDEVRGEAFLAQLHLCRAGGGVLEDALVAYESIRDDLAPSQRIEGAFVLYELTGRPEYLTEARARLDERVAQAPAELREPMLANVPLHRRIQAGG